MNDDSPRRVVSDKENKIEPGKLFFSPGNQQENELCYFYTCNASVTKLIFKPNEIAVIKGFKLEVNCGCGQVHVIQNGWMKAKAD